RGRGRRAGRAVGPARPGRRGRTGSQRDRGGPGGPAGRDGPSAYADPARGCPGRNQGPAGGTPGRQRTRRPAQAGRGGRGRRRGPSRRDTADRLETGYVLALAGIVGFLIYSSFAANAREFPDPHAPLRVQVTGYQWCWRFHYQGQPVTVDAQCNEGPLPTLVLPAGRPVELDVTS